MAGRVSSGSIKGPSRTNSSGGITVHADAANGLENGYIVDRLTQTAGAERVKVVARVRPCIHADEFSGAVEVSEDQHNIIVNRQETSVYPQTSFNFDTVLPLEANQHEVYNAAVRDIVGDVLKGYNGTVMVYGQTGAGKTYTLGNIEPHAIGMIPRAAAEIFKRAADDSKQLYSITMAYIQIYMETIQDLLKPESDNLQLREDATNGVFVAGVHEQPVSSVEQCLHYLELGERNRVFAFTHMNAHSSRSHAVVMLTVRKRSRVVTQLEQDEMAKFAKDGVTPRRIKVGKLFLVDLAGSERLKKSKSEGLRQTEAIHINKSLSTLGNCINARANNSPHVPFRESKLTRLLQESLGGNTKTSLIICISDVKQHMEETLQTLQFGSRAMCVRVKPMVNESIDYKALTDQVMSDLGDGSNTNGVLDALTKAQLDDLQEQHQQEKEQFQKLISALEREREEENSQRKMMTETLKTKNQELEKQSKLLELHKARLDSYTEDKVKLERQIEEMKAQQRVVTQRHEHEKARLQASLADAISKLESTQAQQQAEVSKLKAQLADKHRQMSLRHDKEMQEALASYEASVKEAHKEWQQHADKVVAQKEREMKEAKTNADANLREVRRKLETDIGEVKVRFASLHERYCKLQESERKLQDQHSEAIQLTQDLTAQLQRVQAEKEKVQEERDKVQAEKDRVQAERDKVQAEKEKVQTERDNVRAEKDRVQAERDKVQAEKDRVQEERDKVRAEKDRVQAERDKVQAEKDRVQEERDKVQADKDRVQAEKENQMRATESSGAECEALKDALRQLVSVASSQIQSAEKSWHTALHRQESQIAKAQARVGEVGCAYERIQVQRDGLVDKVTGRGEELHAKEDKIKKLDTRVSELTAALMSEQTVVKDLTAALRSSQSQSQKLTAEVQKLTSELHSAQSQSRGLDSDLQATSAQVQDLSAQLKASEAQGQSLSAELRKTQEHAQGLSTELKASQANAHALSLELSATQDNVKALSAALQSAESRERDLTMQLHACLSQTADLESKLQASEATVARIATALQRTQDNVQDLESQVAAHLRTISVKESEITALAHNLHSTEDNLQSTADDLQATQAHLEDVQGQLRHAQEVGEQQQTHIMQLTHQIDDRNTQIRGLQYDLEGTREVVKQQQGAIAEQEGKIHQLQMELDERGEQLDERQHEVETLSAKVEVMENELQKAHRNRLSLERQLERHHFDRIAALQARSINHRRVWAARTIQKAWHKYRTRRLQMHLYEHGTTINRLDKARTEWQNTAYQFEAKQRKALAQWGADRTREAVSIHLKAAVENIMAAFVLPKKEKEAFMNAKNRMNQFSPMVSPSPASMGNLSPMHAGLHRNTPSPFHTGTGQPVTFQQINTPKGALFRSPKSTISKHTT